MTELGQELYKDKEWLFDQYITKKKSTAKISKICNVTSVTIWRHLKKNEIPLRKCGSSWRKGLTKETNEIIRKTGETIKKRWKEGVYKKRSFKQTKIKKKCKYCKKEFYPLLDRIEKQKYCSRLCHDRDWRYNNIGKKKYNIEREIIIKMALNQNYQCRICGRLCSLGKENKKRTLYIDHCHKTNKIRGLLCRDCNSGLGYLKDNPYILFNAIKYLEENKNGKEKTN